MQRAMVLAVLWVFSLAPSVSAQESPLAPSASYNAAIPTVEEILGYSVGEAFTPYHELERYYQRLAAASERIRLEPYGKSVEGRTLYLVILSTPENLERLGTIRTALARLSDPRRTTPEQAEALIASTPVLVWLSYNVHGNESVSAEAALQVAYELAASQDARVRDWLANAVVILDPIVNPDGHERYVHYYRSTVGARPNPDRFAAEHQERWPGGRTNHYLFDLNRDWAWQTQPESQARVRAYLRWNPQVHVDFHEMGAASTYFFPPPAQPVHETVAPLLKKWFELYGRGNAAAFDRHGFRYYTHEVYDLFYPAYGDSWPSLNGAVGMTYEQAGGGAGGLVLELPEGQRVLTLRDRAARHFVSSLATIDTSVQHRESRLKDYYQFRRAAIRAGQTGSVKQFFLVPGRDPERLARVVAILLRQGIEVRRAQEEFEAAELTSSWGEKIPRKRLPAGTFVVDLAQPAGFVARAMLEREAKLEGDLFYDVTAWSVPLAAGIEAYAAGQPARVGLSEVSKPPVVSGGVEGTAPASAYVFSWEQSSAARLLGHLLAEDFNAYLSLKPFTVASRTFPAGSILVPAETNPASLDERMRALAEQERCQVLAVATQLSEEGIDLGSNRMRFLRRPRLAILTDTPVSPTDYGALWYLFEQRLKLPFTPLRVENLRSVDLDLYNVLILPGDFGTGRGYPRTINKVVTKRLDDWVKRGGVLIALRGGAVFASKQKAGLASVTYRYVRRADEEARLAEERAAQKKKPGAETPALPPPPEKSEQEKQAELERKLLKWSEREGVQRKERIPGAILRVKLDDTHPLAFGVGEQLAVLNRTAPILALTAKGDNVAYYPEKKLKLSGFITEENEKKLAQTAYLLREVKGRGTVVLFAESPVFRGYWDGTSRLLINAVFFGHVRHPNLR